MKVDGCSAIVAGGASGLGEATTRRLHEHGASVTIADLNEDKGAALASKLGEGAAFVRADVTQPDEVEAAYDDGAGVTAEFNRNILHVLNRELDADFEPESFDHVAFFDREREWIEMRLRAQCACAVHVGALHLDIEFAAGEELRTEISAKFTRERLERDYAAAGLKLAKWYCDGAEQFAVTLARRA